MINNEIATKRSIENIISNISRRFRRRRAQRATRRQSHPTNIETPTTAATTAAMRSGPMSLSCFIFQSTPPPDNPSKYAFAAFA